eukprot:jgi/Botrbrau1/9705/Bobra.0201s0035.1
MFRTQQCSEEWLDELRKGFPEKPIVLLKWEELWIENHVRKEYIVTAVATTYSTQLPKEDWEFHYFLTVLSRLRYLCKSAGACFYGNSPFLHAGPVVNASRVLPTEGVNIGGAHTGEIDVGGSGTADGVQARDSGPVSTSGSEDTTSPVNSSLQVTATLDRLGFSLDIWRQSVVHCAVSKNVWQCLKTHMPGTKGDAVALHLLLQKIPEVWAQKVAFMESAHVALKWIISQFEGGANLDINDEWLELLDNEIMGNEMSLEEYVSRKQLLAKRLSTNAMPITTAS